MQNHFNRIFLTIGLLVGLTISARADLAVDPLPFSPGETLTYKLKWGFFHIGTGVLSIRGPVTFRGEPAYQLIFDLRTNGFADALYPVRDRHMSYVNLDFTRTLYMSKKEIHKHRSREAEVVFDWEKAEGQPRSSNTGQNQSRLPPQLRRYLGRAYHPGGGCLRADFHGRQRGLGHR